MHSMENSLKDILDDLEELKTNEEVIKILVTYVDFIHVITGVQNYFDDLDFEKKSVKEDGKKEDVKVFLEGMIFRIQPI